MRFPRRGAALIGAVLLFLAAMPGREGRPASVEGQAIAVRLADGTAVAVVAVRGIEEHRYRYLPARLSLSRRRDSIPEFSFLPYRQNDTSAIDGAVMHLLLRWGLSREQEEELQQLIRNEFDTIGVVDGALTVRPAREEKSWEITSTGALGTILNRGVSSAGHIPVTPGSKFAVSFRFDGQDATLMAEALRGKRGAWGEKFRFLFAYDEGSTWVLEADIGMLLPRGGE